MRLLPAASSRSAGGAQADPGPGSLGDKGTPGTGRRGAELGAAAAGRDRRLSQPRGRRGHARFPLRDGCDGAQDHVGRLGQGSDGPPFPDRQGTGRRPHVPRSRRLARVALARHRRRMGLRHRRPMPDGGADARGHQRNQQLQAGRSLVLPEGPWPCAPDDRRQALPLPAVLRQRRLFGARHLLHHRLDQRHAQGHARARLRHTEGCVRRLPQGRDLHPGRPSDPRVGGAGPPPGPKSRPTSSSCCAIAALCATSMAESSGLRRWTSGRSPRACRVAAWSSSPARCASCTGT